MKPRFSWLLLAILSIGCSDPGEYARFDATPLDALPACADQPFPMELSLLSAQQRAGSLGIFLRTAPDITARSDLFYFEFYQPEEIVAGEEIQIDPLSSFATGKLNFFSSCPFEQDTFSLEGTLRFDSFSIDHPGVISGEFYDGRAIYSRTGELAIDEIQGSWRFLVRRGPPYEEFYALPERPTSDESN